MIRQWQSNGCGGWHLNVGSVEMRVLFESQTTGRFSWWLETKLIDVSGRVTYNTAAGARAACERVARRLGVVL